MKAMQPDPSDFREEVEFRARVYRMLAMGLTPNEVEMFLRRKIDWSLFSQKTVDEMKRIQTESCMSAPQYVTIQLPDSLAKAISQITGDQIDMRAKKFEEFLKAYTDVQQKNINAFILKMDRIVARIGILLAICLIVWLIGLFR